MKEFYFVKTGSVTKDVLASSHKAAVLEAIRDRKPETLGLIIACLKEGDKEDDEAFYSTRFVLEDLGWIVEEAPDGRLLAKKGNSSTYLEP